MCDTCEWEEKLEQCEQILELLDELPEAAEDFAESVREKVKSISGWIEKEEHVTENMAIALDNMEAGVKKWLR